MDTQQIEIIGRNILIEELVNADFEIAIPIRDRGLDLIVYTDLNKNTNKFKAIPIQIKTASKESFNVFKKYEKIANLLIVYLWNINKNRKIFALFYKEAEEIAKEMNWTKTGSWINKGWYSTSNPSDKLKELLVKFEMNTDKWKKKLKV